MIYAATYAKIWGTTFECYPEAPDLDVRQGNFRFSLEGPAFTFDGEYNRNSALSEFCTLAARAPLRKFVIGAMHRTEESWATLFRTFPGMTSLTFESRPGFTSHEWGLEELFVVISRLNTTPTSTTEPLPPPNHRSLSPIPSRAWS